MADDETDVQEETSDAVDVEPATEGVADGEPSEGEASPDVETAEGAAGETAEGDGGDSDGGESDAAEGEVSEEAATEELPEEMSEELKRILRIDVPVIVKLADKELSLGDIIDLSPGSIVEFARSADTSLELLVNNKVIGRGVAVKVGEKFGLRIDEIRPVEETIQTLAGEG